MANMFLTPAKIITGEGALDMAGEDLQNIGEKALIVTDSIMVKLGNVAKVVNVLEKRLVGFSIYDQVNSEPTDVIVNQGLQQYKKDGCDFLIAIGGGSPIDTMKAIAVLISDDGILADYMGKEIVAAKRPKMVAIPTTAGTGSEATQFTIITDTISDIKMLLKGAVLLPDLAIVDPQFTMTAPPKITAATGIDALCHAIEAYSSRKAQPLSDTFALSAAARIFTYLKKAYENPQDVQARTQMAIAATEAGIAFNNSSVTIVHGMSRPIGALFHVAHGLSNAMLLETCLRYIKDGAVDRFADIARRCGMINDSTSDEKAADSLIQNVSKLLKDLNAPTIREYGIDREKYEANIEKMAKDALDSGSPSNTRKEIGIKDMEFIYRELLKK